MIIDMERRNLASDVIVDRECRNVLNRFSNILNIHNKNLVNLMDLLC